MLNSIKYSVYLVIKNKFIWLSGLVYFITISLNLNIYFFYFLEIFVLFFAYFFINFLGVQGYFIINIISSVLFVVNLLINFFNFNLFNKILLLNFGQFFKFSDNNVVALSLNLDFLSYNFCLLTGLISIFVYIYAFSYMRNEVNIINFFFFLKFFVLAMILLLMAGNWITLILGWELIGITSFILINFWSNKITTLKSAFKAFSFNKLSDCFLILSFLLLQTNQFNFFLNVSSHLYLFFFKYIYVGFFYVSFLDVFLFTLIICSFCKSAQFGFHFWLPDSMEAPVPASALIHSATLVSAGIYLLLRFNYLFFFSPNLFNVFLSITSFTAFFGALISSYQTDVKKILAYSTISHCGFLMVSIGLFNPFISILYLFGHGFYKSLNFICCGNLIQHANNYQDFRKMGGFSFYYVSEFLFFFVCIFNLSSFPFFLNFFSKHFFFSNLLLYTKISYVVFSFSFFAAFLGVFYSARMLFFIFFGLKKNFYKFYKITFFYLNNVSLFYTNNFINTKTNFFFLLSTIGLFCLNLVIFFFFINFIYNSLIYNINFDFALVNNFFFNPLNMVLLKNFFFFLIFLALYMFIMYKSNNVFLLKGIFFFNLLLLMM